MISTEEAAQQLGIELHSICFSAIYYTPQTVLKWEKIAEILKEKMDPNLNIKPVNLLYYFIYFLNCFYRMALKCSTLN